MNLSEAIIHVAKGQQPDDLAGEMAKACAACEINTPERQAAFLAQVAHESNTFKSLTENLNYSSARLRAMWPKRFPPAVADNYANQPERIANRAYADRLGNRSEETGDGWRYRGRGLIQITGRANYRRYGRIVGIDLELYPDRAAEISIACEVAAEYWRQNGCNELADRNNVLEITKRINGGLTGLESRILLYTRFLKLLKQ